MYTYSAFFSSGLNGPKHDIDIVVATSGPSRPNSPPASPPATAPSSPKIMEVDPTESENSSTPVARSNTNDRPRLRKRRSSLTIGTSPMQAYKTPLRISRHSMMGRNKSLSIVDGVSVQESATESNSLFGRMRSGSLSGVFRPRMVKKTPSPVPPPTAPLPPVPSILVTSTTTCAGLRPSLTHRGQSDNHTHYIKSPHALSTHFVHLITPDFAVSGTISPMMLSNPSSPMEEKLSLFGSYTIDEEMKTT